MYKIETYEWSKEKLFFIFWAFYGFNRFIIEFFRGDRNIFFLNLTYAQIISLALIFFAMLGIFIKEFFSKYKKPTSQGNQT
jgi:prolipoprotein diacylglyceryltransferase